MKNCLRYLLLVAVVVLEVFGHHSCSANKNCNSSCGDIPIRLPFRLRTDPEGCGYKSFELDCEDNQKTVLYLSSFAKYYVHEINYADFSIRFADTGVQKDNCSSLPHHPLTWDLLDSSNMSELSDNYSEELVFVQCLNPVTQDVRYNSDILNEYSWQFAFTYIDTSSCNYSASHSLKNEYSYVIISYDGSRVSNLEDSCRVEMTMFRSVSDVEGLLSYGSNLTYKDVHDSLVFGFQFSFHHFCCSNYDTYNPCNFKGDRQLCKVPTPGPKGFLGSVLGRLLGSGLLLIYHPKNFWGSIVRTFSGSDLSRVHGYTYSMEYDDSDPRYWFFWLFIENVVPRNYNGWETDESDVRYWIKVEQLRPITSGDGVAEGKA